MFDRLRAYFTKSPLPQWAEYVELYKFTLKGKDRERMAEIISDLWENWPKTRNDMIIAAQETGAKTRVLGPAIPGKLFEPYGEDGSAIAKSQPSRVGSGRPHEIIIDLLAIDNNRYVGNNGEIVAEQANGVVAHEFQHLNNPADREKAKWGDTIDDHMPKLSSVAHRIFDGLGSKYPEIFELRTVAVQDEMRQAEGLPTARIYFNSFPQALTPQLNPEVINYLKEAPAYEPLTDQELALSARQAIFREFAALNPVPDTHEDGISPSIPDMGGVIMPPPKRGR